MKSTPDNTAMQTLSYSIRVGATPGRVWHCLWQPENYKAWTRIFSEGSYYRTDRFAEGSRIHFLTPAGEGMYSLIDKLEENRYMAFRHLGWISNFEEQPIDQAAEAWTNAMETYRLTESDGGTELIVHVDTVEEYVDHMNRKFPMALEELKRLAED